MRLMNSGPEMLADDLHDLGLHALVVLRARQLLDPLAAEVRGHDDHGVAEVDRAALAVRQAAVVEHLEQHVEHVRMRLLDLVEQHDRIRLAPHGLGEIAALLVADVARRRADQPRDGVLLHELRHVDADHRLLGVEQERGERLRELGLADARGAQEQERAVRPVRIGQAPRATRRIAFDTIVERLVLPDDALLAETPPCAAACPSRSRASSRRECRSTSRRPRRPPPP